MALRRTCVMVTVGGSGILENPDSKRNRKVFHKSLVLLWIAHVEYCRQLANSVRLHG
jgi:hypothetical protein